MPSPAKTPALLKDMAGDLRDIIGGEPVDVVIQPQDNRRKKLLVADMDSTMIGQECIDELADYAGFKSQVAAITERAMRGEHRLRAGAARARRAAQGPAGRGHRHRDRRAHPA